MEGVRIEKLFARSIAIFFMLIVAFSVYCCSTRPDIVPHAKTKELIARTNRVLTDCEHLTDNEAILCNSVVQLRLADYNAYVGIATNHIDNMEQHKKKLASKKDSLKRKCASGDKQACGELQAYERQVERIEKTQAAMVKRVERSTERVHDAIKKTPKIFAKQRKKRAGWICKLSHNGSLQCAQVIQVIAAADSKMSMAIENDVAILSNILIDDEDTIVDCGFGQWTSDKIGFETGENDRRELSEKMIARIQLACSETFSSKEDDINLGGASAPQFSGVSGIDPLDGDCGFSVEMNESKWMEEIFEAAIATAESCATADGNPYFSGESAGDIYLWPLDKAERDWRDYSSPGMEEFATGIFDSLCCLTLSTPLSGGGSIDTYRNDITDINGNVIGQQQITVQKDENGKPISGRITNTYNDGTADVHNYNADGSSEHYYRDDEGNQTYNQKYDNNGNGTYNDGENTMETDDDGNLTRWVRNGQEICGGSSGVNCPQNKDTDSGSSATICPDIEFCNNCETAMQTLPRIIDDCVLSGGNSQQCKSYLTANDCCQRPASPVGVNPHLVIPSQNDFICITDEPDAAKLRCENRCKNAGGGRGPDCLELCSDSFQNMDTPNFMERACIYMISEECFSQPNIPTPGIIGTEIQSGRQTPVVMDQYIVLEPL